MSGGLAAELPSRIRVLVLTRWAGGGCSEHDLLEPAGCMALVKKHYDQLGFSPFFTMEGSPFFETKRLRNHQKSFGSDDEPSNVWNTTFTCPVSGRNVSSAFARSLIEISDLSKDLRRSEGTRDCFVVDGRLVFATKEASQISAAMGVMVAITLGILPTVKRPENPIPSLSRCEEWRSTPFRPGAPCYLYELDLTLPTTGESLIAHDMGMDPDDCTRLGVLFPVDVARATAEVGISADVVLTSKSRKTPCKVNLLKPQTIDAFHSANALDSLALFNRILTDWKNYGLGYEKREFRTGTSGVGHREARTYMFVPLAAGRSPEIDWDIIETEVKSQSEPMQSSQVAQFLNRVVIHKARRQRYLLHTHEEISGDPVFVNSPFPSHNFSDSKVATWQRKFNLDIRSASYADYFRCRYGAFVRCWFCGDVMIACFLKVIQTW